MRSHPNPEQFQATRGRCPVPEEDTGNSPFGQKERQGAVTKVRRGAVKVGQCEHFVLKRKETHSRYGCVGDRQEIARVRRRRIPLKPTVEPFVEHFAKASS